MPRTASAMDPRGKSPLAGARIAVAALFLSDGIAFGAWAAHIPLIAARLRLTPGLLTVALFALIVGAIVSMPLAGRQIARIGSRPIAAAGAIVSAAALALPGAAPNLALLAASALAFGFSRGFVEIAMNDQAVGLQDALGRPIMSSFHGCFSLGGFAGSAIAGLLIARGGSTESHLATIALALAAAMAIAGRWLPRIHPNARSHAEPNVRRRLHGPLVLLGVAAFCGLVGEGAMADWTAIYLHRVLGAIAAVAVTGYAAFSIAMAIGRFTGDRIVARFGSDRVVRASGLLAALGMLLVVLVPNVAVAIVGSVCVGFGLSNVVPILFTASARAPDVTPSGGIAAVSMLGYAGFLAGPPIIGVTAEFAGLRAALGAVVLTCLLASVATSLRSVQPLFAVAAANAESH